MKQDFVEFTNNRSFNKVNGRSEINPIKVESTPGFYRETWNE